MAVKEALQYIGEKLSGGMLGAAAKDVRNRPKQVEAAIEKADPTPSPKSDPSVAPNPNNPAGIQFKNGGMVNCTRETTSIPWGGSGRDSKRG